MIEKHLPTPRYAGWIAVWDRGQHLGTFPAIEGATYPLTRCATDGSFAMGMGFGGWMRGCFEPQDFPPPGSASSEIAPVIRHRTDGGCELFVERARWKEEPLDPARIRVLPDSR